MTPKEKDKKSKKQQKQDSKKGTSWFESSVHGGVIVLGIVKEAAEFAPVPYLREAAATTLKIVNMIQAVKDNKEDFQRLGEDATAIIAAIWKSYEMSEHKDDWPGKQMEGVIKTIVGTLEEINGFVARMLDRNMTKRLIYSGRDKDELDDFRDKLQQSINMFDVSSQLEIHEALRSVKKIIQDTQARVEGMNQEVVSKAEQAQEIEISLQVNLQKRTEEENREAAMQSRMEAELREAEERKRDQDALRIQLELHERREQQRLVEERERRERENQQIKLEKVREEQRELEKTLRDEERSALEKAAADKKALEKLKEKERMFFEGREDEISLQVGMHGNNAIAGRLSMRATVESASESDDDDDESTSESSDDEAAVIQEQMRRAEEERRRLEQLRIQEEAECQRLARKEERRRAKKAAKAAQSESILPPAYPSSPASPQFDSELQAQLAMLGINPNTVNLTSSHSSSTTTPTSSYPPSRYSSPNPTFQQSPGFPHSNHSSQSHLPSPQSMWGGGGGRHSPHSPPPMGMMGMYAPSPYPGGYHGLSPLSPYLAAAAGASSGSIIGNNIASTGGGTTNINMNTGNTYGGTYTNVTNDSSINISGGRRRGR